jgi:oligoribonuclease NrnB/cAMP/cGMP phosphodiesterase (DHH superfamily)
VLIYHHNDDDGRCAAAVIWFGLSAGFIVADKMQRAVFRELDYKDADAVDFQKEVAPDEHVIIVDFSFKPHKFKELMDRTRNVTWCDHHRTAANYEYARDEGNPYGARIAGLRDFTNNGLCGAEVTWCHFMPRMMTIPPAVVLLGDYDAWRMRDPDMCLPFYEGLKLVDTDPKGTLWPVLFTEGTGDRLGECALGIIAKGHTAIQYRDRYCGKMRSSFGNLVAWEGMNCYACNIYGFGSKGFGELMDLFDVCISYVHDAKTGKWNVSLYSAKKDVGLIAKQHGGGGHAGAAGFTCERLPWVPGTVGGNEALLNTVVHMAAGMLSGLPQYSDRHPMEVLAELRSMAIKEMERERGA